MAQAHGAGDELLPGPGVYAAYTKVQSSEFRVQSSSTQNSEPGTVDGELIPSAVFVGKRETFGCHEHVIESYLLDFDGDLYEQTLEICLVEKTRAVYPFPSRKALIDQIEKDVAQIRRILAGKN